MKNPHASLSYHELPAPELKTFADGIVTGYYVNNPPFTVLPLPLPAFQALIDDYDNKLSDYENGGEAQKGPFLVSKAALINVLDLLAAETDKVANTNIDTIILAGFTPTKTPGETVKPGQATVTVKRGIAGELISTCELVEGAKHYGCIVTEGAPLNESIIIDGNGRIIAEMENNSPALTLSGSPTFASIILDLTDQRTKHFQNLKHDVTYYFYYYAVNAKGVGPLSEVVSMVCW